MAPPPAPLQVQRAVPISPDHSAFELIESIGVGVVNKPAVPYHRKRQPCFGVVEPDQVQSFGMQQAGERPAQREQVIPLVFVRRVDSEVDVRIGVPHSGSARAEQVHGINAHVAHRCRQKQVDALTGRQADTFRPLPSLPHRHVPTLGRSLYRQRSVSTTVTLSFAVHHAADAVLACAASPSYAARHGTADPRRYRIASHGARLRRHGAARSGASKR